MSNPAPQDRTGATIRHLPGERTWTPYGFNRSELRAIVRWRSEGLSFHEITTNLGRFAHVPTEDRAAIALTGFKAALDALHPSALTTSTLSPDELALRATGDYMCAARQTRTPTPRTRMAALRAAIAAALTEYNTRMAHQEDQ